MMKVRRLFVPPLLVVLVGCQSMTYSPKGDHSLPMASSEAPVSNIFIRSGTSHYLFWGLLPVGKYDVNKDIGNSLAPGERVISMKVKETNNFLDGLLALLSYGIYRPRHIKVTTTVTRGGA